jgi:hypothetical protein
LKAERRFGVILRGGLERPGWNDLDGMIASYGALSENVRAGLSPGLDFTSSWPAVNSVPIFGAEVLYRLTPRLAVGAGFELISKTSRGYYTVSDDIIVISEGDYFGEPAVFESELGYLFGLTVETRLTVIPWTLQGYYFIPLGGIGELFVRGGIGYTTGGLKHTESSWVEERVNTRIYSAIDGSFIATELAGEKQVFDHYHKSTSRPVDLHGGIGLALNLFPDAALVIEAGYRTTRLEDWKGSGGERLTTLITESGRTERTVTPGESFEGRLWYVGFETDGGTLETLDLFDGDPEGFDPQRPVVIRLDGISFRVGLRIRL